ncbi:MAG: hypothetical protein J6S85_15365 [Methanobrevibacter sp.]|nr:hypothetical protein [Methanobrevibacter sp.]
MEYVIKVNAQAIESKTNKSKFVVYNTYIKHPMSGEWVKFNVKFSKECKVIERSSYIYLNKEDYSVNTMGKYPTIFINKFNKQQVIEFDKKALDDFFKKVEDEPTLGDPIAEEDLPFDTNNGKGND